MKTVFMREVRIPSYAMPYLINGDSSGINEDDIKVIDTWYQEYENMLWEGQSIVIGMPEKDYPEFYWNPDFGGLGADCFTCMISILE